MNDNGLHLPLQFFFLFLYACLHEDCCIHILNLNGLFPLFQRSKDSGNTFSFLMCVAKNMKLACPLWPANNIKSCY